MGLDHLAHVVLRSVILVTLQICSRGLPSHGHIVLTIESGRPHVLRRQHGLLLEHLLDLFPGDHASWHHGVATSIALRVVARLRVVYIVLAWHAVLTSILAPNLGLITIALVIEVNW